MVVLVKEGLIEWLMRWLNYEEQECSVYTGNTKRYLENLPKSAENLVTNP